MSMPTIGEFYRFRHRNGVEIHSDVLGISGAVVVVRFGKGDLRLDPREWSFEPAERSQPPLEDGVYQRESAIRFRREGIWYHPRHGTGAAIAHISISSDDAFYRDDGWQYVGPEVLPEVSR